MRYRDARVWIAVAVCSLTAHADVRIEAEDATLQGVETRAEQPGFSGKGYVTGFDQPGDQITLTADAAPGIYDVFVGFRTPGGHKGFDLRIDALGSSGLFPAMSSFSRHYAGKVELKGERHVIELLKGWGYYDIDYIDLVPSQPFDAPAKPSPEPVDRAATAEARALLSYLVEAYGSRVLSGQQSIADSDYVYEITGERPAILAEDFIEYSPSRVANGASPNRLTERVIERAEQGQIVTMMWHWNAPSKLINNEKHLNASGKEVNALWWRGFYTEATTFDVAAALADPQSEDHRLLLRDIDVIAEELKKLQAAGVPVLWRPLHEAEGGWFWWGAKGPEPFVALWRLMFDRLTEHHGLHNLIWVYTGDETAEWYPGDAYVDIIGVDAYPSDARDPLAGAWSSLQKAYGGRKLVALTEFGGVPDIEAMRRLGVHFAYFAPWTGELGPRKADPAQLRSVYGSEAVVGQRELPPEAAPTR